MTISYAITVCNELEEITKLLDFLQTKIRKEDEIVIQFDADNTPQEVVHFLKLQNAMHNYTVVDFLLIKILHHLKTILNLIVQKIIFFKLMLMKSHMKF